VLESNYTEILEICGEIEEEEQLEVFGPQIELNFKNSTDVGEPPIEVTGVAPTVVVEVEEESSMEVLEARASVEKEMGDQAVGTGDEPVLETVEERTGAEPVLEDVEMGTADMPVHDTGTGDSHFKDYSGDDFEKVGEFTVEETSQSPPASAPKIPAEETPLCTAPRRKRFKALAGRTDLPWVRKSTAQRSQTSPASQQTSQKQPFQPTRKSHRLAAQGFVRNSTTKQGPPVIEELLSSLGGSPIKIPKTPAVPHDSPILKSEQASTETNPKQTPTSRPILKRKAKAPTKCYTQTSCRALCQAGQV